MNTYTTLTAIVTLLSLLWAYTNAVSPPTCPPQSHPGYLSYECAGKPHHSSWSTWWHPQRTSNPLERHHGAGATTADWNILYHLGGNGPWVEKVTDVVDSIAVPPGCEVEQVHMMARHAERYPTKAAGRAQKAVVDRMQSSGVHFTGSLSFLNTWTNFWTSPALLEQLTTTGPFSGRLGAFTTGVRLRTRYQHLLARAIAANQTTHWASDSPRVIDTARHFALGFFGPDTPSHLDIIPETASRGANTLTPGRTCLSNLRNTTHGKALGYRNLRAYQAVYLPSVAARLTSQTGLAFSNAEVFAMQELCGFETTVRGASPWCDVFMQEDFLAFEYARDVLHFYRAGPGMRYASAMGWLWLNATTNLLRQGASAGGLFFSFVHDGDIAPLVTTLDVLVDEEMLPTTHIAHDRKWRKSQVSPMGGRVIFELLACRANSTSSTTASPDIHGSADTTATAPGEAEQEQRTQKFIRLNINDGITALPDCHPGPGFSCPLEQFIARTARKGEEVGDFAEVCALDSDAPARLEFLHQ